MHTLNATRVLISLKVLIKESGNREYPRKKQERLYETLRKFAM